MTTLNPEIVIAVWGTERVLTFANTQDVVTWVSAELKIWREIPAPSAEQLRQHRGRQEVMFNKILNSAKTEGEGVRNQIVASMGRVADGILITTDSQFFPSIIFFAAKNPDWAELIRMSARRDADQEFMNQGFSWPTASILGLVSVLFQNSMSMDDHAIRVTESELKRLKNESDSSLSELRKEHQDLAEAIRIGREEFAADQSERKEQWQKHVGKTGDEWADLKKVYDTELGLRAPTTYWSDRAQSHMWQAVVFGAFFVVCLGGLIYIFCGSGFKYLADVPDDKSAIIAVLPVLIPAFAGIWVLRILGRLLSESLLLMRDARERETLVKTFLALMKDESTGKSVVKDEDRILILHSLFRPSVVNAADDAPPVHWFDILANKVGKKTP